MTCRPQAAIEGLPAVRTRAIVCGMDLSLITRHGIFATADARLIGLANNDLKRLVALNECVRLTRGWYAPTTGPIDALERHRLTALALGRQYCGKAAISHYSALVVAGIATYAVDLQQVHLTLGAAPQRKTPRGKPPGVGSRRKGLVLHRPIGDTWYPPPTDGPGVWTTPSTTPTAWAVVQAGLVSGGLSALVSADSALHAGVVSVPDLVAAVARFRNYPRITRVRAALAHADGRHESPGETRTAWITRLLGFAVEPQVEIAAEGYTYRADFRIVGTRVLIEFDGAVKYEADGRALFNEKRREDALRRQGWLIVRIVWDELDSPALIRRRCLEAIELATSGA